MRGNYCVSGGITFGQMMEYIHNKPVKDHCIMVQTLRKLSLLGECNTLLVKAI